MPEPSRCWLCRRSEDEISVFADVATPREREILQQISQVNRFRTKFNEAADLWRMGIPKELRELDFQFVTANAAQFGAIPVLKEVIDAKRLIVDWLGNASANLRKGDGEVSGFGALSPLEKADQDSLRMMLVQFEAKWHRRIASDGSKGVDSNGYKSGFEGMKLFDGLEFVIAVGALYYDVQDLLLAMARRKEINSKPKRVVSVIHVKGFPPVPLCSVCVGVVRELISHQPVVGPAVPEQVSAARPLKIVTPVQAAPAAATA